MNREIDVKPKTAKFISIKLLDVSLITIYYFIFGFTISVILDAIIVKWNKTYNKDKIENRSTLRLLGEICVISSLIAFNLYFIRNLIEHIPFLLDGYNGFQHSRVKELTSNFITIYIFLKNQSYFNNLFSILQSRTNTCFSLN